MTFPSEIAWTVPVIIPLIIGLLVGLIIKHTVKIMFVVVALAILLATFGFISLTAQDVFNKAMEVLPNIIVSGSGLIDVIPYSTTTFIIGLALGLWKA